jgi:hypothetical protein
MCAVAWRPIEAGCISDFHIFQLHLVLYQIVCIGPVNVTSAVFSEELCCGGLSYDTWLLLDEFLLNLHFT